MNNQKLLSALRTNLAMNKEIKRLFGVTGIIAPNLTKLQELIDDSDNQLKELSRDF